MLHQTHDITGALGACGFSAAIGLPLFAWVAKALPVIQLLSGVVGICVGLTTMVLLIERRIRRGPPGPHPGQPGPGGSGSSDEA